MVTTSTLPPSPRPSRRLASIIWSSMCATSRNRIDSGRRSSALPKVGEVHATPKRPNPPKMHFYSGDHGGGARSPHDIALLEDTSLPAPPAKRSMFGTPCAINHIAIRGSVIPAGAIAAETGTAALQCATATSRCSSMGIASCSHQP